MIRSVFLTLLVLVLPAHAQTIKLNTEEYPPFNYREDNEYKGSSIEQVKLLMQDAGLDYTIEMMPWARALSLATTQKDHCVFSTVHNAERDPKFKWVEPLLTNRTVLVRKAGSGVSPSTIEEAKAYSVGTQRDDYTQTILEAHQFPKVDLAVDQTLSLKKLLSGRIDLMPVSEDYFMVLKRQGRAVELALVLTEDVFSIACNPGISDEVVARMQSSLDELIADGTQAMILEKYGVGGTP
ncbi:substrate-binding periplasmic protein (plasmid) [Hoeflea sp. Naph1]|uniref:substrate-binding periplasmic protein n=1 Tax=Hoeflea sp. Naph1 TaxID=3388653 RepID=UPI00398F8EB9